MQVSGDNPLDSMHAIAPRGREPLEDRGMAMERPEPTPEELKAMSKTLENQLNAWDKRVLASVDISHSPTLQGFAINISIKSTLHPTLHPYKVLAKLGAILRVAFPEEETR
jgi:hypothetical protein